MGLYEAAQKAAGDKMSRNTKIVAITAAVLVVAVAALAWLNRGNAADRKAMQESGAFYITAGDSRYPVTMDDLREIGLRSVEASYKTNLMPAVQKKYSGVSLKSVLDRLDVDYSGAKSVSFSGADGYVSAVRIAIALDEENCFIVVEEAGKPLGTLESGGFGPYMAIFAKDRFSQRWCKYLIEITIN